MKGKAHDDSHFGQTIFPKDNPGYLDKHEEKNVIKPKIKRLGIVSRDLYLALQLLIEVLNIYFLSDLQRRFCWGHPDYKAKHQSTENHEKAKL